MNASRLTVLLAALLAAPAWGSCTSTSTSTYTFTNCSDGTSSISQRIGPNTYTTSSDGGSATSYQSGNVTYHTGPVGGGTSYRTGNYAQHYWSDGGRGSSRYGESVDRHDWQVDEAHRLPSAKSANETLRAQNERRARYGHIAGPAASGR